MVVRWGVVVVHGWRVHPRTDHPVTRMPISCSSEIYRLTRRRRNSRTSFPNLATSWNSDSTPKEPDKGEIRYSSSDVRWLYGLANSTVTASQQLYYDYIALLSLYFFLLPFTFSMRPRISIRWSVRPSVCPLATKINRRK